MILEFETSLNVLVSDLQQREDTASSQSRKIGISTSDGVQECFFDFDPNELSVSGVFFQSALDDMVDEYGALDNSEKIGILLNLVKKLMG